MASKATTPATDLRDLIRQMEATRERILALGQDASFPQNELADLEALRRECRALRRACAGVLDWFT